MKHTPGPWIIVENVGEIAIDSPIESNNGDESIEVCVVSHQDDDPRIAANARLIAAAPDLLDELKSALRIFERDQVKASPAQYARIRAAIAKAEGGEP